MRIIMSIYLERGEGGISAARKVGRCKSMLKYV